MAVSGLLGHSNLTGVTLTVETPEEIYDGIETLLTLRLANRRRWLPACLLRFEVQGGGAGCHLLPRGGTRSLALPVTFAGRGVHRLEGARVISNFPINFFVRSRFLVLDQKVTVFPTPRRVPLPATAGTLATRGERAAGRGYEGELTRIGDYRGGEPLKLIHWKLSARQNHLMVKELSAAGAPPLLIDPAQLPGSGLEERLRGACWLIGAAWRAGRPVGLRLGAVTLPPAVGRTHKLRLLTALARYGQNPHTP